MTSTLIQTFSSVYYLQSHCQLLSVSSTKQAKMTATSKSIKKTIVIANKQTKGGHVFIIL